MILRKNSRVFFYVLLFVMIILLFARNIFQIDVPVILFSLLIIVIALFGNRDEILAISMSCIPLHSIVNFYLTLTACSAIYIFKNFKHLKIGAEFLFAFAFLFWELLHCIISGLDIKILIGTLIAFFFLIIVMSDKMVDFDYAFIVRVLAVISVFVCIICLGQYLVQANFNLMVVLEKLRRLGTITNNDSIVQTAINPNTLGIINVLAISGCLQLRIANQNKVIDIFIISLLFVFGLLTASRTFIVCVLLMFIMFVVGHKGKLTNKIRFLLIMIIVLFFSVLLYKQIFPNNFQFFVSRFNSSNIFNGRDKIMNEYNDYISDNLWILLFGIGLSNFSERVVNVYMMSNVVPHNSLQEVVVAWGIPGLFGLIMLFFLMVFKSKIINKNQMLINFIPLLIILAKSMAGQLITSGYTMLALSYAYLSLRQDFTLKKKVL